MIYIPWQQFDVARCILYLYTTYEIIIQIIIIYNEDYYVSLISYAGYIYLLVFRGLCGYPVYLVYTTRNHGSYHRIIL